MKLLIFYLIFSVTDQQYLEKELILKIAGLSLIIDPAEDYLILDYSPCHEKFVIDTRDCRHESDAREKSLLLKIEDTPDSPQSQLSKLLCQNEIWQIWLDVEGKFVFTQPKQIPQRWIFIDPAFETGKIVGNFSRFDQNRIYPLQFIDIVIFSNWLANFGDLILHASGFAYQGEGYCFIGNSGAGKSTLVSDLSVNSSITVLGEDQVILRKIDDQFLVFGTPWHETFDMCSPLGVPLKKVFFLDRTASQVVAPVRDFDAVVQIMQTAFYPIYRPEVVERILDRLSSLAGNVSFYSLAYERGTDVLHEILDA